MLTKSMGLLAATALGLGLVQAASAADLPMKAAPMVVPAPFTWTGFYVGGHVGSGWGTTESTLNSLTVGGVPFIPSPGVAAVPGVSASRNGFIGGVQAGYNWQTASPLVLGIEGDFSWSDVKGTAPCVAGIFPLTQCSAKDKWIADITGRVGVTVDHALLYVKGGVAWQNTDYTIASTTVFPAPTFAFAASNTHTGGLLGVGVEYAFMAHWSAKVEYDYMDFGTHHLTAASTISAPIGAPATGTASVTDRLHIIKAGFNYRF